MIVLEPNQVEAARQGSRAALDVIVRTLRGPIYNLAMRMLGNPADADDATQEILVKIITKLGDLRDDAAAGGWALRVACRHLVHTRKAGRLEALRLTLRGFAADLADGLEDIHDEASPDPHQEALISQVKIGCTLALLTCLSRPLRAAYILGDVFDLTDAEAAEMLEIDNAAFRQRLRRARSLITGFMQARCGIISPDATCRCDRRVKQAVRLGRVSPGPQPAEPPSPSVAEIRKEVARLERGRAILALMRSNPDFAADASAFELETLIGY